MFIVADKMSAATIKKPRDMCDSSWCVEHPITPRWLFFSCYGHYCELS